MTLSSCMLVGLAEPGLLPNPPCTFGLSLLPLTGLKAGQRREGQLEGCLRPCCCRRHCQHRACSLCF